LELIKNFKNTGIHEEVDVNLSRSGKNSSSAALSCKAEEGTTEPRDTMEKQNIVLSVDTRRFAGSIN